MKHFFILTIFLGIRSIAFSQWVQSNDTLSTNSTVLLKNTLSINRYAPFIVQMADVTTSNRFLHKIRTSDDPLSDKWTSTIKSDFSLVFKKGSTEWVNFDYPNNTIYYTGVNVGIGTNAPEAMLDVRGFVNVLAGAERLRWGSRHEGETNHRNYLAPRLPDDSGWDWNSEFGFHHYNRAWYFEASVGIGTDAPDPDAILHAKGSIMAANVAGTSGTMRNAGVYLWGDKGYGMELNRDLSNNVWRTTIFSRYDSDIAFGTYAGNESAQANFSPKMTIKNSGKVGIGTTTPDAELTVKGTIHTQEVKVDLAGAVAPDFVFEEDYPLPGLAETAAYITANKHLPGIPSAAEMEENGLNLKEMNLKLLQKVEELTLHLIEMEKLLVTHQKEIELLKKSSSR